MAFNTGSTLTLMNGADLLAGKVAVNTAVAGGAGTVAATLLSLWSRRGTPHSNVVDAFETATGALSGLVGITAPCGCVEPYEAFIIGFVVSAITFYTPKIMHWMVIDDPVGVFPVHVVGGFLGALCVGIFGQSNHVVSLSTNGILHGGGLHQFGVQLWGCMMYTVWGIFWMFAFLSFVNKVITPPRIPLEDEQKGLDEAEHGIIAMRLNHEMETYQSKIEGAIDGNRRSSLERHGQEMLYFTTAEVKSAQAVNNDKKKRSSVVDKTSVSRSRRDVRQNPEGTRSIRVGAARVTPTGDTEMLDGESSDENVTIVKKAEVPGAISTPTTSE